MITPKSHQSVNRDSGPDWDGFRKFTLFTRAHSGYSRHVNLRATARYRWLLAVVSGVAMALSFPKPGWAGLAWVAPTGLLFAALSPALCCFGASPTVSVSLEPDFEQASLVGQASGAVRLVPVHVLWILVVFLLSTESLRAARSLATRRRR